MNSEYGKRGNFIRKEEKERWIFDENTNIKDGYVKSHQSPNFKLFSGFPSVPQSHCK